MNTVTIGRASVRGIEMDYARFGSGTRQMVILPGVSLRGVVGTAAQALADAYARFGETRTVWLFDRAAELPEGCPVEKMAEDTAAVMGSLGVADADVFGASQGGMIALCLAAEHPELVRRAAICSCSAAANDVSSARLGGWIDLARQCLDAPSGGAAMLLAWDFVENVYSAATCARFGHDIVAANCAPTREELRRFIVQCAACNTFDFRRDAARVSCPVLVVGSEGDRVLTPEASRELAALLGLSTDGFYMYGAEFGHAVYDEAPDFKERLSAFFGA